MNKKKAFTLPEVLISMTILVIVLALVSALVLVVNRVTQTQSSNRLCEDEYLKTSQLVSLFVDTYSVAPFVIDDENTSQNQIAISNGIELYYLTYNNQQNTITAQIIDNETNIVETKKIDFEKITKINFYTQDNLIKCEYIFESYPTYTQIITFGVD